MPETAIKVIEVEAIDKIMEEEIVKEVMVIKERIAMREMIENEEECSETQVKGLGIGEIEEIDMDAQIKARLQTSECF